MSEDESVLVFVRDGRGVDAVAAIDITESREIRREWSFLAGEETPRQERGDTVFWRSEERAG